MIRHEINIEISSEYKAYRRSIIKTPAASINLSAGVTWVLFEESGEGEIISMTWFIKKF